MQETDQDRLKRGMEPIPVARIDREGAIRQFVEPNSFREDDKAMRVRALDQIIARLVGGGAVSEELWHCRSRYMGPLAGHQGLGIVKDGTVLRYEVLTRY